MKKPVGLIYGVDEVPPLSVTALSGLQHIGLISIFLLFPLTVFRAAGLDQDTLRNILSLSMLAMSVAALLSALRIGPSGSGYLCPPVFTAFYLNPALLAVKTGGLSLVFGMTVFAGIVEAVLSRLQRYVRAFFPPELAGLLVVLIAVNIGAISMQYLIGTSAAELPGPRELVVMAITLGTMIAFAVWGAGPLKMFSALLGTFIGYVAASLLGLLTARDVDQVVTTPFVSAPSLGHLGWAWDTSLMLPFAIGALGACFKTVGCVTTCQKINDADWVRPDMRLAERGVLADALGTVCAGMMGTLGINSSPTAIGVSEATGITSRRVAYAIAALFAALAFLPKAASILTIMPRPVISAVLLFSTCFVVVNGVQMISSRLLDVRRTFTIGISFTISLALYMYPASLAELPVELQPFVASPLVVGILCGTVLNMIFRIGTRRIGRFSIDPLRVRPEEIERFMETQGGSWGARRDVIDRAMFNLTQSVEIIVDRCDPHGPLEIEATFDEFNLDVRVMYSGPPLELPERRPSNEEIMESEEGQRRLAGFMIRRFADRVAATHRGGRSTILFHFDH